ncbi:MAG: hypothetical protein ACTSRP_02025 [Candidatus Helarchaeota archaeon]
MQFRSKITEFRCSECNALLGKLLTDGRFSIKHKDIYIQIIYGNILITCWSCGKLHEIEIQKGGVLNADSILHRRSG